MPFATDRPWMPVLALLALLSSSLLARAGAEAPVWRAAPNAVRPPGTATVEAGTVVVIAIENINIFNGRIVASILRNVFLEGFPAAERQRWQQTVRAAHCYLDCSALKHTRGSCQPYVLTAVQIPSALNDVMKKRHVADGLLGDE